MTIRLKTITTLILLLTVSSQLQAKNNSRSQNGPPERPSFSSLDNNSDGDISFDEFSAQEALPFGDHQTVFSAIDSDNNGIISSSEFENHKPPRPQNKGKSHD